MFARVVNFFSYRGISREKQVTTIDNLSNEILLEVFSSLDAQSLRNASLVCKNWDELIGSSAVTMKKFKLRMNLQKIEVIARESDILPSYNRKHVNVDIFYENVFDQITEFIGHFNVAQVRNLKLYGPQTVENGKLLTFLSNMPLLENLDFSPFLVSYETDSKPCELNHLKRIHIDSVNCAALKFIVARKLEKIEVHGYRVPKIEDVQSLVDFLKTAKNLQKLEINQHMFTRIFDSENQPQLRLNLTFFEMSYQCKMSASTEKNFTSFLRSQASTLTHLNINNSSNIPSKAYAVIISQLTNLSTLLIDVSNVPSQRTFYEKLTPSTSVKSLHLHEVFPNDDAAKGFLGNFPNVEKMVLHNQNVGDYINYIAAYNTKLEDFELLSIVATLAADARLNNLKVLTISTIRDSDAWISLVKACPSINKFSVAWVDKDTIMEREVNFLTQQPTLQHLKFDGDYEDIKIIFDAIKINYGNLKTLELVMSNTSEYGTTVTADVKFDFPSDSSEWSVKAADELFDAAWDNRSW
jgi:F-box-like